MLPKLRCAGGLFSLNGGRRLGGALRRCLSTAIAAAPVGSVESPSSPSSKPHFMVDFLMRSCGFSSTEALKASKRLSHLKTSHKPDSVLDFMRSHGFGDAQLKKTISWNPVLLSYDVDKNLKPKFQSLQDWGFSDSDLTLVLVSNPNILLYRVNTILMKIKFWEALLGSKDHLIKIFKRNYNWFLGRDIDKWVRPNIALLHDFGISNEKIALVLRKGPTFIVRRPERFRSEVKRVESLGIPRSSGMFLWALWVLHQVSNSRFDGTKQLMMRSFGWSSEEFIAAFRKAPTFLMVSRELLSRKMDFLVKEVGCKPSEVSHCPVLLIYSLERRLIPRHHALQVLRSRGLLRMEYKPGGYMSYSDKVFLEKFVTPYKEMVPELQELYHFSRGCAV